jgi:GT2 family glycosyltransferase
VKPLRNALDNNLLHYKIALARRLKIFSILRRTAGLIVDVRGRYYDLSQIINQFFSKYIMKKEQPLARPKVGIVLTSYNHIDYTARALKSFYSTINDKIDYELWLLDDNSSEDIEIVYNKYKKHGLKFFKNKINAGLTSLWNKGFELNKDKDYLIICNNDVLFSNHWADNLIHTLSNSIYFSVAVPATNAPGHMPAQHIANFVEKYTPTDNQNEINLIAEQTKEQAPRKTKKGNGFCLAIKISLLSHKLIEGVPFNNKFPLYGNEDEFFSRVKPQTVVVPGSFVFHYKHISVNSNYFPEQEYR